MARLIEKLTPLGVSKKQTPGYYGDGGGLWLQISKFKSKNWVFRYTLHGTRREMGLGPTHTVSLAEARQKAKECRLTLLDGKDPIEVRGGVQNFVFLILLGIVELCFKVNHKLTHGLFPVLNRHRPSLANITQSQIQKFDRRLVTGK